MLDIPRVLLLSILIAVTVVSYGNSNVIIGDPNNRNNILGAYMVEFSPSNKEDGKILIVHHLVHTHGLSEHTVSFRSATRTNLFHGHSFQLSGSEINEMHLLDIPGALKVYRVFSSFSIFL